MIPGLIARARKIVIKIGSATLTGPDGRVNRAFLDEFAAQAAGLIQAGKRLVLVSSGARIAGLSALGTWRRKEDIHYKQALCAVGQVELMGAWRDAFSARAIHIAQILLTRDDFDDPIRTLNMRNTLFTLVDEGIIPIINENDTVCVEEIKIGDNDTLAAQSAALWSADLLILFSDIDGLYESNPKENPGAPLVPEVGDIAAVKTRVHMGKANPFGTGGIATKIEAARYALSFGIPMILAHGGRPRALEALASGTQPGTAFVIKEGPA